MIETIKNLLEIQSIDLTIKKHLDAIEKQKLRINNIRSEQDTKKNQNISDSSKLESKKKILASKEKEMTTIEEKISKAKKNLDLIKSKQQADALTNEITSLAAKKTKLEAEILTDIETIESLGKKIVETNQFLVGIEDSLSEIQKDIDNEIDKEKQEISTLTYRIENLEGMLDPATKRLFKVVNTTFKYKYPLSLVHHNVCMQCHFNVERNVQTMVEKAVTIEQCPNCSRILVPNRALN